MALLFRPDIRTSQAAPRFYIDNDFSADGESENSKSSTSGERKREILVKLYPPPVS